MSDFSVEDLKSIENVEVINANKMDDPDPNRTGSFALDFDLTRPFPAGRITEIFGENGCGKSTVALECVGQALRKGKKALYLNMERNLNRSLLMSIRTIRPFMNDDADCPLKIANATCGEDAFNVCRQWAETQPNSVIVLDSVDACVPRDIVSGEIGDKHMGTMGKLMSEACRSLIGAVAKNNVAFIFINQFREKVGLVFGDPKITPGGKALGFYSSQRVLLKSPDSKSKIRDEEGKLIGHWARYEVVKNKCAPQGQEGQFPILYGYGIDRETEMVDMGIRFGILSYGGKGGKQILLPVWKDGKITEETVAFPKAEAAKRLREIDVELMAYLESKLLEVIG
jgi:recombination protein RecA